MEQRSEEWFAARIGKVTASKVADVLSKTKNGYGVSRDNYLIQLAIERITKTKTEFYSNSAMKWGTDKEPFARAHYEMLTGNLVDDVGLVDHPSIEWAGASPDGLVGVDGLIEIKCPNTSTHLETFLNECVPQKYVPQIQFQIACTERKWCDFVSFDPRLPEHAQIFVKRVHRDQEYINTIESEIKKFLQEVEEKTANLITLIESKL